MARKRIDIDLSVNLSAKNAAQTLNDLKNNLASLSTLSNVPIGSKITAELSSASHAAGQLKLMLEQATNVNTGKLNLRTFEQSLRKSGLTLLDLQKQLQQLGPQGSQAFTQLASSVANANSSISTGSVLLEKFKKSLGNVITWNISSSVFNAITSSLQDSVSYVKDLNKSLTDIRIVSDKGLGDMAKFAEEAGKTAKSLSTTTKEYVDASLIFFQQGLSDEQVEKRTQIVTKMAAVTGESASDVSSYMTAIWNNFSNGSDDLEDYADKMAALGAATAASSEEIAAGMKQFAAVAKTVGLSYDYAATAVATVVSETQQSADTVGTAFKTIFGRLESLSLGESLDDGVTLTKYSQALETVGVKVLDQNNELKRMDVILQELGAKWDTISTEQQVALAQTVGGMRQYNNFLALMDNWGTFEVNLEIAQGSEGALEEQHEKFEQGVEGALNRLETAKQNFFKNLIDEDFMIDIIDFLAEAIEFVDNLVDNLGGVKGVILIISNILLRIYKQNFAKFLGNLGNGLKSLIPGMSLLQKKREEHLKTEAQIASLEAAGFQKGTSEYSRLLGLSLQRRNINRELTAEEQDYVQSIIDRQTYQEKQLLLQKEELRIAQKKVDATNEEIQLLIKKSQLTDLNNKKAKVLEVQKLENDFINYQKNIKDYGDVYNKQEKVQNIQEDLASLPESTNLKTSFESLKKLIEALMSTTTDPTAKKQLEMELIKAEEAIGFDSTDNKAQEVYDDLLTAANDFAKIIDIDLGITLEDLEAQITDFVVSLGEAGQNIRPDVLLEGLRHDSTRKMSINRGIHDVDMAVGKKIATTIGDDDELLEQVDRPDSDLKKINQNLDQQIQTIETENTNPVNYRKHIKNVEAYQEALQNLAEIAKAAGLELKFDETDGSLLDEETKAVEDLIQKLDLLILESETAEEKIELEKIREKLETGEEISGEEIDKVSKLSDLSLPGSGKQMKEDLQTIGKAPLKKLDAKKDKKQIEALEASYKKLAKTLGITEKEQSKINKLFDKLKKSGGNIRPIEREFQKLLKTTKKSKDELNKLKKILSKSMSDEEIEELFKSLSSVNNELDEAENKFENLEKVAIKAGNEGSEALDKMGKTDLSTKITNIGTAISNVAMAWQAAQSLGSIWTDEDLTTGEKLMQTMMAMSSILPVVTMLTGAYDKAKKAKTLSTQLEAEAERQKNQVELQGVAATPAKIASDKAKDASTNVSTGVQWSNNLAIMSNPWLLGAALAALAIAIVVIAAVSAATAKNTKAQEAKNKADDEAISKSKDKTEQIKEESEALVEASKALRDNIEAYENGEGTIEDVYDAIKDLNDSTTALRENQDLQNLTLEQLTHNYDAVIGKVKELTIEQLRAQQKQAQQELNENTKTAQRRLGSGSSSLKQEGASGWWGVLGFAIGGAAGTVGAMALANHIQMADEAEWYDLDWSKYKYITLEDQGIISRLPEDPTAEQLVQYYDELEDVMLQAQGVGITEDSEIYSAVDEYLDDNKDTIDNLRTQVEDTKKLNRSTAIEVAATEVGTLDSFTNQAEFYQKVRDSQEFTGVSDAELKSELADYELGALYNAQTAYNNIGTSEFATIDDFYEFLDTLSTTDKEAFKSLTSEQIAGITNYEQMLEAIASQRAKVAKVNYAKAVEELGLPEDWGNALVEAIKKNDIADTIFGDSEEAIYKVAEAQLESNLALKEGIAVWEDNRTAILAGTTNALEYATAIGEVQAAIEKFAGVELSDEFFSNTQNMEWIDELYHGNFENIGKLYVSMAKDYAQQVGFDSAYFTEEIAKAAYGTDLNSTANGQALADDLLKAVTNKDITTTEAEDILRAYGYAGSITATDNGQLRIEATKAYDESTFTQTDFLEGIEIDELEIEERKLDKIAIELDKISEAKDRAFGTTKLAYLDAERKKLEELKGAQEVYLQKAREMAESKVQDLTTKYGSGDTNDDGYISPEEELAFREKYKYDQDAIDALEAALGAQKAVDDAKEELNETAQTIMDNEWENFETNFELKVTINERDLTRVEHELSKLEDSTGKLAEKFDLYGQKMSYTFDSLQIRTEGVQTILEKAQSGETLKDNEINNLLEYQEAIYETESALIEMRDAALEELSAAFEELNADIEEAKAGFDMLTSTLEAYTNVVQSLGKVNLGNFEEITTRLQTATLENTKFQIEAEQANLKALNQTKENLQAKLNDENISEQEIEEFQKQIKATEDLINESQSNLNSLWEAGLTTAQEIFTYTVEQAIETMNQALGDIAALTEEFNQQSTLDNQYLDDYERIYQLSKMSRSLQQEIDKTDSVRAKNKLAEIMEEINEKTAEGVEMSQQDLNVLQKKYELRKAEIALEEAQNAKSQVRLRRDADGNMSYIYTANQSDIDAAQQAYEDKMYELEKMNDDYIQSVSEQWLSAEQSLMDTLNEIQNDTTLTAEEREAKLKDTIAFYQEQFDYMSKEMNKTLDTNKSLYEADYLNYNDYYTQKADLATKWSETALGILMTEDSLSERFTTLFGNGEDNFGAIGQLLSDFSTANTTLTDSINSLTAATYGADTTIDTLLSEENIRQLLLDSEETKENVEQAAQFLTDQYKDSIQTIRSFVTEYNEIMKSFETTTKTSVELVAAELEKYFNGKWTITKEAEAVEKSSDETEAGNEHKGMWTGGLTSAWGPEGKALIVHEKELILNKFQTEDMFYLAELAQAYVNQIEGLGQYQIPDFVSMISQIASSIGSGTQEAVIQEITVQADFPGVNSQIEIENAFKNIVNMASQYANRD